LAPSKLGVCKRKFQDEDEDPSWTLKGNKKKLIEIKDRPSEYLSPFRKPLQQCSTEVPTGEDSSFHVKPMFTFYILKLPFY